MAYGLATRDAGGNLEIYGLRKLTRLIKTLHIGYSYSGDISVPEFDDTIGAITFYPKAIPFLASPFGPTTYGSTSPGVGHIYASMSQMPTLAWDNTTKKLTVTPATNHDGSTAYVRRPDYVVNMIHYK